MFLNKEETEAEINKECMFTLLQFNTDNLITADKLTMDFSEKHIASKIRS